MRNNGASSEQAKMIVVDPVARRVLTEVAALLQGADSLKIVINKAGGAELRVKIEVSRYLEFGGAGTGQHG